MRIKLSGYLEVTPRQFERLGHVSGTKVMERVDGETCRTEVGILHFTHARGRHSGKALPRNIPHFLRAQGKGQTTEQLQAYVHVMERKARSATATALK